MEIKKTKVFEVKGTATKEGYGDQHYERLVIANNATEAVSIWELGIMRELRYYAGEASSVLLQGEAILGDNNE